MAAPTDEFARYLFTAEGICLKKGSTRDLPHPSSRLIVMGRFMAAARRPHADTAFSGVDRL
jgi:hypothetical protein